MVVDDAAVARAAAGDEVAFAAITQQMMPLIQAQISRFPSSEAERQDLEQECLVALLSAVRSFRADGGALFTTYATACIHNRLVSLFRRSDREHWEQLDGQLEVPDVRASDPADHVLAEDLRTHLRQRLTPLEYAVLLERLEDRSYEETAARLGVSKKTVDNAVQRLRRKFSAED